ncbi:MAG: ABC transporter substrate-binding protein [Pseudomonadota bacterium]
MQAATRRDWLRLVTRLGLATLSASSAELAQAADKPPVFIGLDAEFGHKTSTSAQAVQQGMQIAMDEINQAGGVLDGRKLELLISDNRSIPAIGVDNLKRMASQADLVGVFGAKFSPVIIEWIPVAQELELPIFAAWSSADEITEHDYNPSYCFRLSLKDAWAAPALLRFAVKERHARRVGLLLANLSWGRSNQAAIHKAAKRLGVGIVGERWFNAGETSLLALYQDLRNSGAQAVILVANEIEGSLLIREIAALPAEQRLPIISHWGVTGGDFVRLTGAALGKVDLSVVQTYSFIDDPSPAARRVLAALKARYGVNDAKALQSPVGVAHAYDLTHLLARAIDKAGSADRRKIRDALERLEPYDGLVRYYAQPFSATRHDALSPEQVFMARYAEDGSLVRIPWSKP